MSFVENVMRNKLVAGKTVISLNLSYSRTVGAGSIARECGFDWLFIDMEHSSMDLDTVAQVCVAALPTGITPVVRVPSHDAFQATRVLDAGAMGVVVPHVNSAEDAQRVVRNCKYPPLGQRSLTSPLPHLGYATAPAATVIEGLNQNTLLIVMMETAAAIQQAEAIAAVPGIDALMIGTTDLSADLGIPGNFAHPSIADAYARLLAACRTHGKHAGMGGIYDQALMERFIRAGVRLVLGGSDISFMMAAARSRISFLRGITTEPDGAVGDQVRNGSKRGGLPPALLGVSPRTAGREPAKTRNMQYSRRAS